MRSLPFCFNPGLPACCTSLFVVTVLSPPLRLCPDSANATERHGFLNFASFLAQLGPHPFLPELLGVVSLRAPLVTVVEELENRDLLGFLWRCREVDLTVCCSHTRLTSACTCTHTHVDGIQEVNQTFTFCFLRKGGILHVK